MVCVVHFNISDSIAYLWVNVYSFLFGVVQIEHSDVSVCVKHRSKHFSNVDFSENI